MTAKIYFPEFKIKRKVYRSHVRVLCIATTQPQYDLLMAKRNPKLGLNRAEDIVCRAVELYLKTPKGSFKLNGKPAKSPTKNP